MIYRDSWGVTGTKHAPMNRKGVQLKLPGRVVGVIAVEPEKRHSNGFNPLQVVWAVHRDRKDFMRVLEQNKRGVDLPKYPQQLFDSCFKNWGAETCHTKTE